MAELWSKLMVNCAYNAISGIAQATYGKLAALGRGARAAGAVVARGRRARRGRRRQPAARAALEAMRKIAGAMPAQLSSTAQDMARGKPSEIDHLNGFVARRGAALGIATPANQALYALVRLIESERGRALMVGASPDSTVDAVAVPVEFAPGAARARSGRGRRAPSSARRSPAASPRTSGASTPRAEKNLVAAGVCDEVLVQVSYAIGVAQPTSINVNTYGTAKVKLKDGEIAKKVEGLFDMRPYFIEQRLKLRNPIYSETAAYGHMGRKNEVVTKIFKLPNGKDKKVKAELFTWEKLDYVDKVKKAFGI